MTTFQMYDRARQLLAAREISDLATRAQAERDILAPELGQELLDRDEVCRTSGHAPHADLPSLAATELFAKEIQGALRCFAEHIDTTVPPLDRYSPYTATTRMLRGVWRTRQVVDNAGVPYPFYTDRATRYLYQVSKKRLPVPSQLMRPDVVRHVLDTWTDSAQRTAGTNSAWEGEKGDD